MLFRKQCQFPIPVFLTGQVCKHNLLFASVRYSYDGRWQRTIKESEMATFTKTNFVRAPLELPLTLDTSQTLN